MNLSEGGQKEMFENKHVSSAKPKAGTGITGLDQILLGGFPLHRLYLVEGAPGTGKTTAGIAVLARGPETRGTESLCDAVGDQRRTGRRR